MKLSRWLLPFTLLGSLFAVYVLTMAPGLTWANHGADGGDLIAATAVGGVPHPTGYPVYLLLAWAFQLLPIGPLAFRTNLLSALAAASASLLAYRLVARLTNDKMAGLVSGFAFGLSPLLWSQAVITEVYALHAFFAALIVLLAVFPNVSYPKIADASLGLAFGLALGNHFTTILLFPALLTGVFSSREKKVDFHIRPLIHRLAWMGMGLFAYVLLPLRALSHPLINWGNPITLKNFLWLVSAQYYQKELFSLTTPIIWQRSQFALALLVTQVGIPLMLISLMGLFLFTRSLFLKWITLWMALACTAFAIGYGTLDSFVYLIPTILSISIWLGLGVDGLTRLLAARLPRWRWTAAVAALLLLVLLTRTTWPQVDASQDARAEQFGRLVMAQMPANAMVFASGDQAVFSLWYFHFALGQRPDLVIVANDLLPFAWYQQTLHDAYPTLTIPGPLPDAILAANPNRPVCIVEYDGQTQIRCP